MSTVIRWGGTLLFVVAAGAVCLGVWIALHASYGQAFSVLVYGFSVAFVGVLLRGMAQLMDDLAAVRSLLEDDGSEKTAFARKISSF